MSTVAAQTRAPDAAPFIQGADNSSFAVIAGRAVQTHPELRARRSGLEAQDRSIAAAGAAFRPRIDLTGAAGYERATRLDGSGGTVSENGPNRRATLSVRQPLYDGAEVSGETERLGRIGNVRYFELRQAEDGLVLELARAWSDQVRQRTLIDISQANVLAHERVVSLVQSRVTAGVGRGVDLDQAQGRLSSARLVLASDEGALAEATSRFQRAAMSPPPANLRALSVPPSLLPGSESEALSAARGYSPTLRASIENQGATQAEVRIRRAAYLPRVAIEGRHDLTARTATLRDAASSSLLLTFNYNLYAGGGDIAREQDALLRLAAARQQHDDAALGLGQSVAATWAEYERQLAINRNANAYAQSVLKTRDVYRTQYEIGQRSLLDLLNTENELAQALRQETNSRTDALQAQLRLLAQTGRLFQAFGVARNDAILPLPPLPGVQEGAVGIPGAGPQLSPRVNAQAPATGATDATAPSTVNSRLLPTMVSTLPAAMSRAMTSWLNALDSGADDEMRAAYLTAAAMSGVWSVNGLRPAGLALKPRVTVIQIEQIDDNRTFVEPTAQLAVLTMLADPAGVRCVRGAQVWRRSPPAEADGVWKIARERVVVMPDAACRSR